MTNLNNLDILFNPRTIAIVGASDHEEKVGGILMKKALKSKCNIIPVNPSHELLFGLKCYKSVIDIKEKIDLAVIAIPKELVVKSIEDCAKKGIKSVIIISAGFSEIGDSKSEQKIMETAKKYGIRILGPNCFGIFNSELNLDLTFSNRTPGSGEIVFISQSGALWSYLADLKLGFRGFIGLGNMADLEFNDVIEYFLADKNTKSIILYIEKLKNGNNFLEVCKKANKNGKKIYAVLAGKSKEGKKATFSHTASLASDYEIYKGAFKQVQVKLCSSLEEAIEDSGKNKIKETNKKIKLHEASIITNAGGAGALVSDYLAENSVKVNSLKDILGTALAKDYLEELERTHCNEIIAILTSQSMSEISETARVIADFKKRTGKLVLALFLGQESVSEANQIFEENKIPFFNTLRGFRDSLI